jgi:hypothetical protein
MVGSSQTISASALRPDFDAFLFAKVDEVARDLPLRVVSVLARLDLDPWAEAAELTQMPKDTAVQRLTALLTALPDASSTNTDPQTLALRLIGLLPAPASTSIAWSAPGESSGVPAAVNFAFLVMLSMIVMAIIADAMHLAAGPLPGPAKAAIASAPVLPVAAQP